MCSMYVCHGAASDKVAGVGGRFGTIWGLAVDALKTSIGVAGERPVVRREG